MHVTNLEGGAGPYEVTSAQADEISRRIQSEVPRVPGIPRTIVIEDGIVGSDRGRTTISVEPLVGSVDVRYSESDTPVLPDDVRRQIGDIVEQVRMAA